MGKNPEIPIIKSVFGIFVLVFKVPHLYHESYTEGVGKLPFILTKQHEETNVKFSTFVPGWYILKFNDMLVISSREFRQNQKMYFEKADKGEQIIVQRGKDKAYALTPVSENDVYFNAEMVKKIKQSIE